MQSYELEGMAQANAVLTRSNLVVMTQLAQDNCYNERYTGAIQYFIFSEN